MTENKLFLFGSYNDMMLLYCFIVINFKIHNKSFLYGLWLWLNGYGLKKILSCLRLFFVSFIKVCRASLLAVLKKTQIHIKLYNLIGGHVQCVV